MKKEQLVRIVHTTSEISRPIHTFAGAYIPDTSGIYISKRNVERIVSSEYLPFLRRAFAQANKSDKYETFFLVAMLGEEFAHFVQHTRECLPDNPPVTYSTQDSILVNTYGLTISSEDHSLIQCVMRKTFEIMGYTGKPPASGVTLVDGDIIFRTTNNYLTDAHTKKHYSMDYPFEQQARAVQSRVLDWWFRDVEKFPFSFTLGT